MAKPGNNAAYQQLTPTPDTLAGDLQNWASFGLQKRREERFEKTLDDQAAQQRKKEKQELYDKYVKPLNNYDTGSTSLNESQGRLLQEATKQYIPLIQKLEDPNVSDEEKLKARLKLESLNQLPESLKTVTDFHTNQWNSYQKGIADGTIWKDPEYEKQFQKGFSGIELGLDDNGYPTVAFVDKDGDGVLDVQPYERIKQGIPTFDLLPKWNSEEWIKETADKLGTVTTKDQEGFTTKKTVGIPQENLDYVTDKIFKDEAKLKSALKEADLENTPENVELIKNNFKRAVMSQVDTTEETTIDQSGITARMNANRLANPNEDPTTVTESEPLEVSKSTWGGSYYNNIDRDKVVSKSGDGVVLEAPKDYQGKVYNDAKVLNYTFDKFGSLLLDIEYTDPIKTVTKKDDGSDEASITETVTEQKTTQRKVIQVSREDARDFAQKKGMSINDLKNSVQKTGAKPNTESNKENDPLDLGI